MFVASLVVAILAVIVALVALLRDHSTDRRQRGLESTQVEQAEAIAELVAFERARAAKEAEREAEAARRAAEEADAEAERLASASLDVMSLVPRPGVGRKVKVMNDGAHPALLLEGELWGPQKESPTFRSQLLIPEGGVEIEDHRGVDFEVGLLGEGRAWWRLVFPDGREDAWSQTGSVDMLPRFDRPHPPDPPSSSR